MIYYSFYSYWVNAFVTYIISIFWEFIIIDINTLLNIYIYIYTLSLNKLEIRIYVSDDYLDKIEVVKTIINIYTDDCKVNDSIYLPNVCFKVFALSLYKVV